MNVDLFKENGEKAELKDVCSFLIENYPDDVFTGESGTKPMAVAVMVYCAKKVMAGE